MIKSRRPKTIKKIVSCIILALLVFLPVGPTFPDYKKNCPMFVGFSCQILKWDILRYSLKKKNVVISKCKVDPAYFRMGQISWKWIKKVFYLSWNSSVPIKDIRVFFLSLADKKILIDAENQNSISVPNFFKNELQYSYLSNFEVLARKLYFLKIYNSKTKRDIFTKFENITKRYKNNKCSKFQLIILKIVFFIDKKVEKI